MLLQEIIDTYEELKKYVFIINRGDKLPIIIKFKNENFFHLVGLHKCNFEMFIPHYIKSKDKKYKYIKKNIKKFNNILMSEISGETLLTYRVETFHLILDLLKSENTTLYNLQSRVIGSVYNGDFGLLKIYEKINCLLGLVIDFENKNSIYCAPQSWMANIRINNLIQFKRPIYMEKISIIPLTIYDNTREELSV